MAEKEISQHPDSMNTPYEKHLDREQHAGHDNGGLISDALSIEIGTTDNEVFSMSEVFMAFDWYDSRPFSLIGNPGVSLLTSLGMAYPLFYVFLPDYLATRGAQTGQSGPYYQWRNYAQQRRRHLWTRSRWPHVQW